MSIKRAPPPPTEEGFDISVDDLKQIMELRKKEAVEHIAQLGGHDQLVRRLQTSETAGQWTNYLLFKINFSSLLVIF